MKFGNSEKFGQGEPSPPDRDKELIESDQIRAEFFQAMDATLKKQLDEEIPKKPEDERKLEEITDDDGKVLGVIDEVRNPREAKVRYASKDKVGRENTWLVVDFDDVINKTTTAHELLKKELEKIGLSTEDFNQLYDSSKIPNAEGKKVLRFDKLVEGIKTRLPDKEKEIDQVLSGIDYSAMIDQAVKHALQGVRLHRWNMVRVSVLTYGDLNYQKMRIDSTDLDEVVDDIIYTEGSKKEVLEALMKKQYPGHDESPDPPFTVVVDDSPTHVEDYEKIELERNFVNVRFHHPQAKRYGSEAHAEKAVIAEETERNQAALNIYQLSMMSLIQGAHETREVISKRYGNPQEYQEILVHATAKDVDSNIQYRKEGSKVIRECDYVNYLNDSRHGAQNWEIAEDETLKDTRLGSSSLIEDYIKNAE